MFCRAGIYSSFFFSSSSSSPPCFFFFFCPLFPHILNLYSIPAKCQDPWGRCTKSVLPSQLLNNDGVCRRHRLKSPPHAFALDAVLPSGELCLFHEKIMATRGVQPLCLTWIPAVWTLRHVLSGGRRAARRRRVVSLTLLLFFPPSSPLSLSLSENPWCALLALLCRPGENVIGGVIYLCYYYFIFFKLVAFYRLNANNECVCFLFNCPSENMATHSSKGEPLTRSPPPQQQAWTNRPGGGVRPRDLLALSSFLLLHFIILLGGEKIIYKSVSSYYVTRGRSFSGLTNVVVVVEGVWGGNLWKTKQGFRRWQ